MAEANRSIPQIPIIRITTAAHVLAQFRARQAVKDQLRKQGLKVSRYAARDITAMACEYLSEHREELMLSAIATVMQWTLEGYSVEHRRRHLVVDCLNTKLPKSLNVVLHGLERFGGVPLPIRDLARDP